MERKFLQDLGLENDAIEKIMAEHGKTFNAEKDAREKAEQERDSVKSQVSERDQQLQDRDQQLDDLKKQSKAGEDMQAKIDELKQENERKDQEYQEKINKQQFEYSLEKALSQADAKNPNTVKPLLNTEKMTVHDGKIIGLDEQIEKLKQDEPYLFGTEKPAGLHGREAGTGQQGGDQGAEANPFLADSRNLTKQGQLVRNEPEKARKMIAEAGGEPANYGL